MSNVLQILRLREGLWTFANTQAKGDTGSGVSYRSIMYIPAQLPKDFWQKIGAGINNVRLMVKRVFITDDLGEEYMPRWLSFLKVTVDGRPCS